MWRLKIPLHPTALQVNDNHCTALFRGHIFILFFIIFSFAVVDTALLSFFFIIFCCCLILLYEWWFWWWPFLKKCGEGYILWDKTWAKLFETCNLRILEDLIPSPFPLCQIWHSWHPSLSQKGTVHCQIDKTKSRQDLHTLLHNPDLRKETTRLERGGYPLGYGLTYKVRPIMTP